MCSQRGRAGQVVGAGFSGKRSQLGVRTPQAVKKLGDGWTIKTSDSKIIIFSFASTELTKLLFTYIGELEITGCSYSDWDGKVMKAKVLNQNQDKWNINFGTFGSDARKPEEIETRKIIGRKVRKSII